MKVRIILSDHSWEYRLKVFPVRPGAYAVQLRNIVGAKLPHGPSIGHYPFDEVLANAPKLYLQLVAMYETNKVAAAAESFREVTLNHTAEHGDLGVPHDLRGDPRFDDTHPKF